MTRGLGWYNGYSPQERIELFKVYKRLLATGDLAPPAGPCELCGDPDTPVESHSEDYAMPYRWSPPAAYSLCPHCHRHKLHQRFHRPELWVAFLAHVRRGGYASDLKNPFIRIEFEYYRWTMKDGRSAVLRQLRPYTRTPDKEWFAQLRMDPESRRDRNARPR